MPRTEAPGWVFFRILRIPPPGRAEAGPVDQQYGCPGARRGKWTPNLIWPFAERWNGSRANAGPQMDLAGGDPADAASGLPRITGGAAVCAPPFADAKDGQAQRRKNNNGHARPGICLPYPADLRFGLPCPKPCMPWANAWTAVGIRAVSRATPSTPTAAFWLWSTLFCAMTSSRAYRAGAEPEGSHWAIAYGRGF